MAPAVGSTPYAARRRRPRWLRYVFVALLLVPIVEIFLIVQVGRVIGAWPTVLLLVLESLLGAWLVRREGGRAWRGLSDALRTGKMPSRQLADAALVLVGGALLLTPGFVTDVVGFFFILPITRPIARRFLEVAVARRLLGAWSVVGGGAEPFGGAASGPPTGGADGPTVVPGEVLRDDESA